MSYSRESKRVLSGSLNLLQPGDKIPDADGTQMENWRVDQAGALVSRGGIVPYFVYLDQQALYVQSMSRRGSTYYYGAGTRLYRGNNPNAIQTGFDGNPISAIAYNGYSWFMNQLLRCKDGVNPTTGLPQITNWGIAAPTNVVLFNGSILDPGGPTAGLQGSYQWYFTFVTVDGSESNPSPASAVATVAGDAVLTVPNFSPDVQIIGRNVYRTGGTLGQAYQVGTINDNVTYVFTDTMDDLTATLEGIPMPINHDLPPACAGVCGPYQGLFLAWNGEGYVNRVWYSLPNQPQYWPGALLTTGQWFNVGDDGEAIVAIVPHARMAVIYKQRSIWRLIGDPFTGYLERSDSTTGALAVNGVCNGGQVDYLIGTEGIYLFDSEHSTKISPQLDPLFRSQNVYISDSLTTLCMNYGAANQAAIGYANGRLYFSFAEQGQTTNTMTLVYHVDTQRWYTMRYFVSNEGDPVSYGFACFLYANPAVLVGGYGQVLQLESGVSDSALLGALPMALLYQSRYEDCGSPDNQKVYLDVTIEAICGSPVTVMVVYNNGAGGNVTLGTMSNTTRGKATFPLGTDGVLAINMAVRLQSNSVQPVTIYSVYFSYYVEARLTDTVSTIPIDLGSPKVKQVKEVQADLDCTNSPAVITMQSDLPGNQLVTRQTLTAAQSSGRRMFQLPTSQTWEGRLWRFSIDASGSMPGPFRLYSLRMLTRVMAVYVEAYEAAAGYVWDSMEQDFSKLKRYPPDQYNDPVKRARNLQFDIEADGAITAKLYSDLPNSMNLAAAPQFTATIAASGVRQIITLPMPQGLTAMVEGRIFRLILAGTQQYKLFDARLEVIEMGVYVEGYEAAGGATYDSREVDFGSAKIKEARELQLDVETSGPVTAQLLSDFPGFKMQVVATTTFNTQATTTGRRMIHLVVPQLEGRLWRLLISGANAFRLYGARLEVRQFGEYYDSDEAGQGGFWDSTELDLGARNAKEIRDIEFELWAYAPVTVTLYLDLPGNTMTSQLAVTFPATAGRRKLSVPLPENSPYVYGRLLRVTMTGTGAFKLFGARVNWRPIGTYVEGYEGYAGAIWDSTVVTLADGKDVVLDQVRFELDAPNTVVCSIYTDLPGETLTLRQSMYLTTGTNGRSWATIEMPGGIAGDIQGRVVRVTLSSDADFRVYQGQTFARQIGRYLAANVSDTFRTLDWDGGSERVKSFKKIEVDAQTDGPVTLTFYTNQSGSMASVYTTVINTSGLRQTLEFVLPFNIRGRLMRIEIGGQSSGRLYGLRVWLRAMNEPEAKWDWVAFTLEPSEAIAAWKPLPVEPTPAEFQWTDLPVPPTSPAWSWQEFTVKPTDPQWSWGEFNVAPTSDQWEWVDIPMDQVN